MMPDSFILVLEIVIILVLCQVVGFLFSKLSQPRVVGEMFAGILLGPSFLGWMAPSFSAYVFRAGSLGHLSALSQVGVVVFMFLVGLNINPKELRNQGHAAILTSHVSITAPFLFASLLAVYLYPQLSDRSVSFTNFVMFVGASMSITAFPVLARILEERNWLSSRLGTVVSACAAVDDATGWCILAYIGAMVRATHRHGSISVTIAALIGFVLLMIYVAKPLLRGFERVYQDRGHLSEELLALMILLLLGSALFTEWIGVHLLFGSFLLGANMPKNNEFVRYVVGRFETVTVTLLLPLFFAFTGLRTNIALVKGPEMWIDCLLIILVATLGKLGGTTLACWTSGMPIREAAGVGVLMNTRGLMELIILNIGLDIKVISPAMFSMMVLMALTTTLMTAPLLSLICPDRILLQVHSARKRIGSDRLETEPRAS